MMLEIDRLTAGYGRVRVLHEVATFDSAGVTEKEAAPRNDLISE